MYHDTEITNQHAHLAASKLCALRNAVNYRKNISDGHVEVGRAVQLYECLHSQLNSFEQEAKYSYINHIFRCSAWR